MQLSPKALADRILKACTHLVLDAVFFGACLKRLKFVADPSCETAWTDGVSLGYNPEYLMSLQDAEITGLFVHEVLHVTNGHSWRRGSRDPDKWNVACDYAINPIVLAAKYQLPDGGLVDARYYGKCAEQIYQMREEEAAEESKKSSPSKPSSNEDGEDSKTASPDKDDKADEGSGGKPDTDGTEPGEGSSVGGTGEGESEDSSKGGSGDGKADEKSEDKSEGEADGKSGDKGEASAPPKKPAKPKPAGEVRDAPSGTDPDTLEAEWKVTIDQAAKAAKMMGNLPGPLAEMIPLMLKPNIDWRATLRLFMEQSWNSVDYTWRLPSSRFLSLGLYLPRLASESLPCIAIAEDISASVPLEMKSAFQAEERVIIEELTPEECHLLYCDTAIRHTQLYRPGDDVKLLTVTAGGTDFRPVFEWIEKEGISPACLVFLTDLEGLFPAEPPPYPVLWVTPPTNLTVPFGEIVEMRD